MSHAPALAAVHAPAIGARTDDPELARLAAAFSEALDELDRLWPEYERLTDDGSHPYADIERFEDTLWEPAAESMREAEAALFQAMRDRGLSGVVAGGRIFLGPDLIGWERDVDYPERISASGLGKVAVLDGRAG